MAKIFVRNFLLLFVLFALLLSAINVWLDPQGIFHTDKQYRAMDNRALGRFANSLNIRWHDYDTIVAGTSRVQSGIDPRLDAFNNSAVYNVSLGDTDINEITTMLRFTLTHQLKLKTLYIGLDLHPFSKNRYPHVSYDDAPFNPENNLWLKWLQYNFSIDAVTDDWAKITQADTTRYWVNGHYHSEAIVDYPKMTHFILWHYMQEPSMFGCFDYDVSKMQALQNILLVYVKKGVNIHLFISPQHAKNLMILDLVNQFETYFRWMRDALNLCNSLNLAKAGSCDLWNFSGFNAITTETIVHDTTSQMQNYFETSHYKDSVGAQMIQSIQTKQPFNGFGEPITNESIDAIIETMRYNISHYKTAESAEYSDLISIFNQSKARREKQCQALH